MNIGPISHGPPPQPLEASSKAEKELFVEYANGLNLLATANLPEPIVKEASEVFALIAGISKTVADPKITHQNERIAIAESLKNWTVKWGRFSKKHPGYGLGIVLGFVLVSIGAVMIIGTLSHLPPIKLVHGYVTLGVAIGVVSLYYGITLIDMGRRAAIKERWEMKIAEVNRAKQASRSANEEEIKDLRDRMIREIDSQNSQYKKQAEALKQERDQVLAARSKEVAELKAWRTARKFLEEVLKSELFPKFPQKMKNDIVTFLKESGDAIASGGAATLEQINSGQLIEPLLSKPLSDSFVIPEVVKQPENAKVLREINEKFQDFLEKTQKNYVKYPISTGILLTGIVVTLVSLPVLYYYLTGAQSIYVIGAVGLEPILHFLIYGLSLVYEGRNSASISKLEEKARSHEQKISEEERKLEAETLKRTEWLCASLKKIHSFQREWKEFFSIQENSFKDKLVYLQKERADQGVLVQECAYFFGELAKDALEFTPTMEDQEKMREFLLKLISIPQMLVSAFSPQEKS